ncbi:N-acetylmuramoyl-L-alanine amidase family 2 [Caldithrix abyssi DSM 13497]|uniref:N-acetylmuramoyl-L-alanine amidase n=1 Tax=Caldithrix abyssi DSM 13497 TaxID=880073 RepID=H1XPW1_CALAY|nr:peptidoglycan recognition family protein [Caldithrix abyssi]APF20384.1 N-acetylmuramoyl-L-alanine amidase [Caldithrix abyssi DSM 13497]EHO41087.1 N-acetylmuramoyl-L-alanine amidase family 2 [Caldithrix abyssi DSM 13497]
MRPIRKIIIHCTDSEWGNVQAIDAWHKQRGWDGIGYHFLIGNVYPEYQNIKNLHPVPEHDGLILEGRPIEKMGAHCRGHNYDSIGVALVGVKTFSKAQLYSLINLLKLLMKQFQIDVDQIYGHYEFDPLKSCPNIDVEWFKKMLNF